MKFKRQDIFGYPFYMVQADSVREDIPVLGWVGGDALGDGWWSYETFPNIDAPRKLHETRQAAAEYLARSEDSPGQEGEGAPGRGVGYSRPGCFGDEGMTTNYNGLRQVHRSSTTLKTICGECGWECPCPTLALLDENAALRDLVIDAKVMITASWLIAENGPAWMERAKRVLALADAS